MTTTETPRLVSAKSGNPFTFESQVCGRCGGSGQYSYCSMYGSRCFGCDGHGIKLTKRGAAAQAHFEELLKVNAEDLQVGQKVRYDGIPGIVAAGWFPVEAVEIDGDKVTIKCDGLTEHRTVGSRVRIAHTAEEKRAAKEVTLAFQATLTKAGKPRKR